MTKVKKVELIELFFDLIYVYAISKLSEIIHHAGFEGFTFSVLIKYLIAAFVILQGWLYLTNYVNRFGKNSFVDYVGIIVNMFITIYLSNTITTDWVQMYFSFNLAMFLMLLSVCALYFFQKKTNQKGQDIADFSIKILLTISTIYLFVLLFGNFLPDDVILAIDFVAVLLGIFLPVIKKANFDTSVVNFPHLLERFQLLVIMTFGEAIVTVAPFFNVQKFSIEPLLLFLILISLFGSYAIQTEYMIDHHRKTRGTILMYTHFFIVISLNLLVTGLSLLLELEGSSWWMKAIVALSVVIFLISFQANNHYVKEKDLLSRKDINWLWLSIFLGSLLFLFSESHFIILLGILLITTTNFLVKLNHLKRVSSV